jgi:bacterioferritin-associated ferredoxin
MTDDLNDPIICLCYAVRESTIKNMILECKAKKVWQVTEACDAGSGCGSCHYIIDEMIQEINP